jgi:hypothetical protein
MRSKEPLPERWFQSEFAKSLGHGLFIFLTLVGIGSCDRLCRNANGPLILIHSR